MNDPTSDGATMMEIANVPPLNASNSPPSNATTTNNNNNLTNSFLRKADDVD